MIKYALLLGCFILSACSTNKSIMETSASHDLSIVENIAREKFGDNYFLVPNSTNEYSLVKSKTKTFRAIGFDINFFIFDYASNKVIIEDFLKSGHVDWIDDVNIKAVNRKLDKANKRTKVVYLYNAATQERKDL